MSGHSKWSTIKRQKAAVDAKRGKIFSVIAKELTIAARDGGGSVDINPRLRTLIQKAKTANMPNENVERAIKKGTGELPGVQYESLVYEGYGPAGVGIITEVTTDNKNRSASTVRSVFSKAGYELAKPGALAFNFTKYGQFLISKEKVDEDRLMEVALDAGAEDIKTEEEHFEVLCSIAHFDHLSVVLTKANIVPDSAELAWIPQTFIPINDPSTTQKVLQLIDNLENLEDVQAVYANADIVDGSS